MQIAVEHCNRLGLAGVHDAGVTRAVLESLLRLDAAGSLTLRVYGMLDSRDEALIEEFLESGPQVLAGGRLAVRAIKVYADGALGSRGAALLAPYSDDRDNTGLVVTPPDSIEYLCERALEAGFQVCTHAIGDRGNRVALDAYEKALRSHPTRDHRFRIEHCQVLDPQDIPRFATLGVVPSMQPTHATSDMYWAGKRLGAERLAGAYAWRWLIDEGNPLPLGSDFPVESANPMWGIYAAVTRQDADGWPEGGWFPAQCITVEEAVRGFTRDAAYARFAEDELGTLAPGMAGDVTVLDRDIFSVSPPSIRTARVVATIVAGRVVFENRTLR
jgi:hypothetical protein